MLKTDPGLTTELPMWLMIFATTILLGRIGLFFYEHEHPPVPSDEIHWQDVKTLEPEKQSDKMLLYYFTTNWSGSVRKLESNAFSNKDTVKFINENFTPKKVVDLSVEDHANEPQIQKLEDKYGLSAVKVFPKLIVALPDGTEVNRSIGARNAALIDKFLDESIKSACYVEARQAFKEKNWQQAASLLHQYLEKNGAKADRSTYALIREYFCLRLVGKKDEAEDALRVYSNAVDPLKWPYPVLQFMTHKTDQKQLLKETGDGPDRRMEMQAYKGAALYFEGKIKEARQDLRQATADNHFKEWPEYQLAEAILELLPAK